MFCRELVYAAPCAFLYTMVIHVVRLEMQTGGNIHVAVRMAVQGVTPVCVHGYLRRLSAASRMRFKIRSDSACIHVYNMDRLPSRQRCM